MVANLDQQRITVIGAGVSGVALALLAKTLGARVFLSEKKTTIPDDSLSQLEKHQISFESGGHSAKAWDTDLVVISSGISPKSEAVIYAGERSLPVVGEIDFVVPYLKGGIIAVTGSNGKTTTTSLIGHVLSQLGLKVAVAGNIGNPISCFAGKNLDYIVVELSSFQLYWTNLLKPDLAVITNLAPDHIDWHGNYSNYISAKSRICQLRKRGSWVIIQERDIPLLQIENMEKVMPLRWSSNCSSRYVSEITMDLTKNEAKMQIEGFSRKLISFEEVSLIGDHNLENVAMALASVNLTGLKIKDPASIMKKFTPPPHRCELVGEVDGVSYVDDSKGTNVAASKSALSSIKGKKVVILGGRGKGEDYGPLAEEVKQSSQVAILLGEESDSIAKSLENCGFSSYYRVSNMEEAVLLAARIADPGMTVLLSPACTSWDMYSSYKKRGEHFQKLVKELPGVVKDNSAE